MPQHGERWLVTGASGQLGGHILHQLGGETPAPAVLALAGRGEVGARGIEVRRIDLRHEPALRAGVLEFRPTHIVHVGAMTSVAEAYEHPADAERINVHATRVLAQAAADGDARFVFSSTDMVFDGTAAPYRETDAPSPLSHYGQTKAAAEQAVLELRHGLVVRLPLMYGGARTHRPTTFAHQIAALRAGELLRLFVDEYRTPICLVDAARAIIGLARSEHTGLLHVAGPQRLSRFEMVATFARVLGIDKPRLEPVSRLSINSAEPRPADLSLDDSMFRRSFPDLAPGAISVNGLAAG